MKQMIRFGHSICSQLHSQAFYRCTERKNNLMSINKRVNNKKNHQLSNIPRFKKMSTVAWELLYEYCEKEINKKTDLVIAIAHWLFIEQAGFRCLGTGDEVKDSEKSIQYTTKTKLIA